MMLTSTMVHRMPKLHREKFAKSCLNAAIARKVELLPSRLPWDKRTLAKKALPFPRFESKAGKSPNEHNQNRRIFK